MRSELRIIDANANRAREALRVMEDAARFLFDDEQLSSELKSLRHDLRHALMAVEGVELYRDTPGDVGTMIDADNEHVRDRTVDVVIAAGKRLSEALRSIEEYSKAIDPSLARAIERLRYRGYDAEAQLHGRFGSGRGRQWRVCVLLTESLCRRRSWREVVETSIAAGADCIQLREKSFDDGALLARASALVDLVGHRACVIINDRPDIALLAGADGVHLGQQDLPVDAVRRLVGRRLVVGVSTSSIAEARAARAGGADYCGVGPMFHSTTKLKGRIAGATYLAQYVAWGGLPHLAIGGITPSSIVHLAEVGCRGVAVSRAVCEASDPGAVVDQLRSSLEVAAGAQQRETDASA